LAQPSRASDEAQHAGHGDFDVSGQLGDLVAEALGFRAPRRLVHLLQHEFLLLLGKLYARISKGSGRAAAPRSSALCDFHEIRPEVLAVTRGGS
jgi:hypothetical protein